MHIYIYIYICLIGNDRSDASRVGPGRDANLAMRTGSTGIDLGKPIKNRSQKIAF